MLIDFSAPQSQRQSQNDSAVPALVLLDAAFPRTSSAPYRLPLSITRLIGCGTISHSADERNGDHKCVLVAVSFLSKAIASRKEPSNMHDCKGRPLAAGDIVLVPFKIVSVYASEEYCNASLETVASMYPGPHKTALTVNTKQVIRANEGDETSYEVVVEGDTDGGNRTVIR